MSLSRIALRIAAVEALKGATLVEDHVLDSPNGALDIQADGRLRTEEDRPFVSVFTDKGSTGSVPGRSLVENGDCDITFEIGVSTAMFDTDRETGVTMLVGINIPASDRNHEIFLDVVEWQIRAALTDPDNEWAEIYRSLHYSVKKIEYLGARSTDDGQKLAGHQMKITVSLMDDPARGSCLDDDIPLARFVRKIEASNDPGYIEVAARIRALISGESIPWLDLQRRHGMTAGEVSALGLGPVSNSTAIPSVADLKVNGVSFEVRDDR